jgi:hypothetical protein
LGYKAFETQATKMAMVKLFLGHPSEVPELPMREKPGVKKTKKKKEEKKQLIRRAFFSDSRSKKDLSKRVLSGSWTVSLTRVTIWPEFFRTEIVLRYYAMLPQKEVFISNTRLGFLLFHSLIHTLSISIPYRCPQ